MARFTPNGGPVSGHWDRQLRVDAVEKVADEVGEPFHLSF
jgi:hypothetical protein